MKHLINVVWFKRDLRLHDHYPLHRAVSSGLPVLPLYIVEPEYWRQAFASRRHWSFIHDCLLELRADTASLGQALVVRQGTICEVIEALKQQYMIDTVFAHEESGNGWTYKRDESFRKWCLKNKTKFVEYPSNGVVRRLRNRDEWASIRNARMAQKTLPKPKRLVPVPGLQDVGVIPSKEAMEFGNASYGLTQAGGRRAGVSELTSFLRSRGQNYLYNLSAPGTSELYCSRLSPHLSWGSMSVKEVSQALEKKRLQLIDSELDNWGRNLSAIRSRLAWRCHFIQKIEDQPSIEFKCMHPLYEGMREDEHNKAYMEAWETGTTGFPFIDACMRNLNHTGWITFRMRAMLVSFASYHLWLDWRRIGYVLARLFTDYEPGIHYSQLQMQSGVTGINTVRIYNPVKQSHDQDPSGLFIKKWLPELAKVSPQWVHEPWLMSSSMQERAGCRIGKDYPLPIVDNALAMKQARKRIAMVRKLDGYSEISTSVYKKLGSRKKAFRRAKPIVNSPQMSLL